MHPATSAGYLHFSASHNVTTAMSNTHVVFPGIGLRIALDGGLSSWLVGKCEALFPLLLLPAAPVEGVPPHVLLPIFRPMPPAARVGDSPELWATWEMAVRALQVCEDPVVVVRLWVRDLVACGCAVHMEV